MANLKMFQVSGAVHVPFRQLPSVHHFPLLFVLHQLYLIGRRKRLQCLDSCSILRDSATWPQLNNDRPELLPPIAASVWLGCLVSWSIPSDFSADGEHQVLVVHQTVGSHITMISRDGTSLTQSFYYARTRHWSIIRFSNQMRAHVFPRHQSSPNLASMMDSTPVSGVQIFTGSSPADCRRFRHRLSARSSENRYNIMQISIWTARSSAFVSSMT